MINHRTLLLEQGTGIRVGQGWILTCHHVIANRPADDTGCLDETLDVALIPDTEMLDMVPFATLQAGERFCAFGHANALGGWIRGQVAGANRKGWIQMDLDTYDADPGFSGAGVWDEARKRLCGIIVAKDTNDPHKAYFIPIASILQRCPQLAAATHGEAFSRRVFDGLDKKRIVVLFSQDFTEIETPNDQLREALKTRYQGAFHRIEIPMNVDDPARYFREIAQACGLGDVFDAASWHSALSAMAARSIRPFVLHITGIEYGDETLNRQFATILRTLKSQHPNFRALLIGRKSLAALVYKNELSPLYNATEMLLFPSDGAGPDEEITAMEFEKLYDEFAEELAMLLDKTDLGRYNPYPHNPLINTLFWKNLLRKEGNRFVWRDDRTVNIGREVLAGDR